MLASAKPHGRWCIALYLRLLPHELRMILRHCGTAALNRTPKETLLKFRIPLHPKVSHGDHVCLLTSHRELNWIELAICHACSRTTTTTSPASHPSASSASHAIDACPGVVERSTCELQFSQRSPMSTYVHSCSLSVFHSFSILKRSSDLLDATSWAQIPPCHGWWSCGHWVSLSRQRLQAPDTRCFSESLGWPRCSSGRVSRPHKSASWDSGLQMFYLDCQPRWKIQVEIGPKHSSTPPRGRFAFCDSCLCHCTSHRSVAPWTAEGVCIRLRISRESHL